MSADDAQRWDRRYTDRTGADRIAPADPLGPPAAFAHVADLFPRDGHALEIACGAGETAVWLAQRGMTVVGIDISSVAIASANALARDVGVPDTCTFAVHDLDEGLPEGRPVDLLVCHMFRDRRLDHSLVERLCPHGLLAIAVLSEVGAEPGRFRARPGELADAFSGLEPLDSGEADGRGWLLARSPR